jgi:hypothetical protein
MLQERKEIAKLNAKKRAASGGDEERPKAKAKAPVAIKAATQAKSAPPQKPKGVAKAAFAKAPKVSATQKAVAKVAIAKAPEATVKPKKVAAKCPAGLVLGCSKCRWKEVGCAQCKRPEFQGARWNVAAGPKATAP